MCEQALLGGSGMSALEARSPMSMSAWSNEA